MAPAKKPSKAAKVDYPEPPYDGADIPPPFRDREWDRLPPAIQARILGSR